MTRETVEILNRDGSVWRVNGARYEAMRRAMMAVLPETPPGPTFAELKAAILPYLDGTLFPGGAKAGWWLKSLQLDHEARGIVTRGLGPPLRFWRAERVDPPGPSE